MASFDIVSKVEMQDLENAINNLKREVENRYDFQGSGTVIELKKKELQIELTTENDMKMGQLVEMLIVRLMKQKIDPKSMDTSKTHYAAGKMVKKEVGIKNGIDKELSKKIVKIIKDSKLKVQTSIMEDQIRVTGKQIDDLQEVIILLKGSEVDIPLQFVNMKG